MIARYQSQSQRQNARGSVSVLPSPRVWRTMTLTAISASRDTRYSATIVNAMRHGRSAAGGAFIGR